MLLMKCVTRPSVSLQISDRYLHSAPADYPFGELVENDAAPFVTHLLSDIARQFHAAILGRQHQFSTKRPHSLPTLNTLVFRYDENHPITAHRRRHR